MKCKVCEREIKGFEGLKVKSVIVIMHYDCYLELIDGDD